MAAQLHERALAVGGRHRLEAVERPLDLLLQREVVLDDEQGGDVLGTHVKARVGARGSGRCRHAGAGGGLGGQGAPSPGPNAPAAIFETVVLHVNARGSSDCPSRAEIPV
jgi:hypothetical protein